MPLYMDIHTVDSNTFSVEDVVKAHMEDLAIQEQFGVIQLKYWVNVEAKILFCLMKGPNKEACNEVHKQSHGNTACNIIEVSDDEFNLYLGAGGHVNDLAYTTSGEIDTGYRTIIAIKICDLTDRYKFHIKDVYSIIVEHEGAMVLQPEDDIIASFIYASKAMLCSLAISKYLNSITENVEFIIALSSGRPVDEKGDYMFEETKKKIQYLCAACLKNTISLDFETQLLFEKEKNTPNLPHDSFKIIRSEDFDFLFKLFEYFEESFHVEDFTSKNFYRFLGLSKSQAYRKLKSLTGMAPNQLFQELRLRQSLEKIKLGNQTISELAFALGFNSASYFTKVFRKRFGISPSSFTKML